MKLHAFTMSPNSRKVESLVGYLGLDVAIETVDLAKGEQKNEAFVALNPNGKVPVLEDEGFILWESNAILTYLADKHPDRELLPAEPRARADVMRWLFWQTAHVGPAVGKLFAEKVLKGFFGGGEPDQAVIDQAMGELAKLCTVLDKQLAGKEHVCGSLSVVDFALGAWAEGAPLVGFGFEDYPNVHAWVERTKALPGWVPPPQMP